MAAIKVEGYSGCPIRVFHHESHGTVLEKRSESASYVPRLLKQMNKQASFTTFNAIPDVFAPAVLYHRTIHVAEGPDSATAKDVVKEAVIAMRFEHHTDAVAFLDRANLDKIKRFGELLIQILDQYIAKSPMALVPREVFTSKFEDVEKNLRKNKTISVAVADQSVDIIRNLCAALPEQLEIPIGLCHGDLTLSNILLQEYRNKLILIDFLDAFVESPLADIAKLRQDLKYGWTLRLYKESFDPVKILNILRYFDKMIMDKYGALPWVAQYLDMMFILNQLRVLQYCKDPKTADYLLGTITPEYASWQQKRSSGAL